MTIDLKYINNKFMSRENYNISNVKFDPSIEDTELDNNIFRCYPKNQIINGEKKLIWFA